jgi:hypothetical protein
MMRVLPLLWLLGLQTGCLCANKFHAAQPVERSPAPFSSVTVAPFQLRGLQDVPDDAREMAKRLTQYVADEVDAQPPGTTGLGRTLRVEGRFTEYRKVFLFRPGTVEVEVTFRDETGALLARGSVSAGNPKLGRGAYASCTSVEELGGGIVNFMKDSFEFPR